jgi:hypothetical protein
MSNPLSDIYAKQVLLSEEKGNSNNVVAKAGDLKISKTGKEPLESHGGDEKVKKDVKKPEISKEYTGTEKGVKESMQNTTNRSAFGGTFEKLFKATLTESDVTEDAASDLGVEETVPTTPEAAHDEIHDTEDEVTDLADDLRSVISHLEAILSKISGVEGEEAGFEAKSGGEEAEHEEEQEFEESLSYEPEPKELGDKSGVYQGAKKANTVKTSDIKAKGGKAQGGKLTDEPEPKAAADKSGVYQGAKKANTVKSSSIKVGDFFK